MTKTQFLSWLFNGVCLCAGAGVEMLADTPNIANYFPPKYAHAIALLTLFAILVKAQRNLKINPDGTKAEAAYIPPDKKP